MIKTKILGISLAIVTALNFSGCGSSSSDNTSTSNSIKLKANFQNTNQASLLNSIFSIFVTNAYAFDINQVAKVIVLNHAGSYETVDINTDGSFEIDLITDDPSVIIFANISNGYLGYLSLSEGMESIPSHLIKEEVKVIEIGQLDTNNTVATPTHSINLTDFVNLNANEKLRINSADDILAIRAKNADMDNNGIIDLLENKNYEISPYVTYKWNVNENNQVDYTNNNDTKFQIFQIELHTFDKTPPSNVYFTGPNNSGLLDSINIGQATLHSDGNNHYYSSPIVNNSYQGEYTILYNSTDLNFNIPNLDNFSKNMILPKANFTFDENNKLIEINWIFETLNSVKYTSVGRPLQGKIAVTIYTKNGNVHFEDYNGDGTRTKIAIPSIDRMDIGRIIIGISDDYGVNYNSEFTF